jgi:hypothetical protein
MFKQRFSELRGKHALSLRALRVNTMNSLQSPFYFFGPPLLLMVAIPLASFAAITTTIAICALTLRASFIYFELVVALLQAYFFPAPPKVRPSKRPASRHPSPTRTRHRRSSIASSSSSINSAASRASRLNNKSAFFVSLFGTGEITRDYEGVGGWRVSDGPDEDATWLTMNSRLELPAMSPRNHRRSLTAGSQSPPKWSPVTSRARTPNRSEDKHHSGGFFSLQPSAVSSRLQGMQDVRRKSTSTSSTNSLQSSRRSSTAVRIACE